MAKLAGRTPWDDSVGTSLAGFGRMHENPIISRDREALP